MKHLFCTIILLCAAFSISAQDDINLLDLVKDDSTSVKSVAPMAETAEWDWSKHRHNLVVSWGAPSLIHLFANGMSWLVTMGDEVAIERFSGVIGIEYDYNIKKWLRVGGRFSYQYLISPKNYPFTNLISTAGRLDFTYVNKRKVRLYSGLEVGFSIYDDHYESEPELNNTMATIDLAIVPFGLQAGGEHVYFMGEFILGTTEFCRMGIGYRF